MWRELLMLFALPNVMLLLFKLADLDFLFVFL
jgi:hypothetical protein